MFVKITGINVRFLRSKYISELRDEKGRIVPGTGATQQTEVVKFKRNKLEIPEEVKNKLSEMELDVLTQALRDAFETEQRQKFEEVFDTLLTQMNDLIEGIEYLKVNDKQLERYVTLSALLNRKLKAKLNKVSQQVEKRLDE